MRHLILVLFISITLLGCSEKNYTQGIAGTSSEQRKTQISELLNFKDEQAFWKIYADYAKEISDIQQEHAELTSKFNQQFDQDKISEQQAINMLAQYFRIEAKSLQVKQNYMYQFQQALPLEEVFRLYQLDHQ